MSFQHERSIRPAQNIVVVSDSISVGPGKLVYQSHKIKLHVTLLFLTGWLYETANRHITKASGTKTKN